MARIVMGLMMIACGCTMIYAVWCDMAGWAAVFGMLFAGWPSALPNKERMTPSPARLSCKSAEAGA